MYVRNLLSFLAVTLAVNAAAVAEAEPGYAPPQKEGYGDYVSKTPQQCAYADANAVAGRLCKSTSCMLIQRSLTSNFKGDYGKYASYGEQIPAS